MDSVPRESAQPSFGERRGHRLAPLNTNFTRPSSAHLKAHTSRLQRPRPTDYPSTNGSEGPVPLQSPVTRQHSKSSLRSLFSRDKPTRAATAPDRKLDEIDEAQQTTAQTVTVPNTPLSPGILTPKTTASTPALASPTTPRARLKTARTPPIEPKPPPKEQYGWKPPPLLQAYPQAIKHECLSAPAMSTDSILRLHATMNKSGAEDGRAGKSGHDESGHAMWKKKEQKERRHLRTLSGTINKVEWSKKIYVLATTGYILQYAGEGKNDRLPEKMLQLGPQSVAFASDAIPGKHWVLQVSRDPAADAGPAPPEPPKPKFARFGFHRSPARRLARSFLLVFDNPDSMISWLMAVRAEIEARGGPKFTAEKHSDEGAEPQLRSKTSVRQMVKKDPHRVSSLFLQPQNLGVPNEDDGQSVGGLTSRRSSYVSVSRPSVIESRTGSMTSTVRTEAISTAPSDARVSSFTSANNLPSSPPGATGPFVLDESRSPAADSAHSRSPPSSSHGNFQSPYTSAKPQVISTATRTEPAQANSPSFAADPLIRSASPPAPNFSLPSFSKKFASRTGPLPIPQGSPSRAGVLRREESTTDFSTSNASSPPVSPTYSVASSRFTDSTEPPMLPHDGTGRRTLRAFNSEDALSRMVRSGNPASTTPNPSRFPRGTTHPSEYSETASRPPSMVGRSGLGIQLNHAPGVPIASQAIPSPPFEPGPRSRLSTAQPDSHRPQSMSRRKSMPGLVIGPPTAPPPNCPLPKIPSPIARQAPPPLWSSTPEGNDRSNPSSPAREHVQDSRKSAIGPGMLTQQPSSGGLRSAARQSRIPQ